MFPGMRHCIHAVGPPEASGTQARAEIQEAKQKESEASIRAAALEAEIEQHRCTQQEMQILLEDTAQRLQVQLNPCKDSSRLQRLPSLYESGPL